MGICDNAAFYHENAPMFTLSQPTTGYCSPTHLPSTSLIQFSVCVSQACVASHKWTRGSVLTFQEKDSNRPYAISHVTNVKTNSGRKSRYFAAILSGKNDGSQWSLSTGEQFVSSFLTSARNKFTFLPGMHKVSTGTNAHSSE